MNEEMPKTKIGMIVGFLLMGMGGMIMVPLLMLVGFMMDSKEE